MCVRTVPVRCSSGPCFLSFHFPLFSSSRAEKKLYARSVRKCLLECAGPTDFRCSALRNLDYCVLLDSTNLDFVKSRLLESYTWLFGFGHEQC